MGAKMTGPVFRRFVSTWAPDGFVLFWYSPDGFEDRRNFILVQLGSNGSVDESRWPLVAHPYAGGVLQRYSSAVVSGSERDTESFFKGPGHLIGTMHPLHNSFAQPYDRVAFWRLMKKMVEAHRIPHLHAANTESLCDPTEELLGQRTNFVLHVQCNIHQPFWISPMLSHDFVHSGHRLPPGTSEIMISTLQVATILPDAAVGPTRTRFFS
jgi:hypothetical protein